MHPQILLSFDVEEFDIPQEFGQKVPEPDQFRVSSQGLKNLLVVLDKLDVTATFFTTANFALHQPDLIKHLASRHEIASHGYWHSAFEDADLLKSRQTLEQIAAAPVTGFRRARLAPTDHAAIRAAGYSYNSSENPIWLPGRYNNFFKTRTAYYSADLLNIPISASPGLRIPLFWLAFKNLPMPLLKLASRQTLAHDRYLNIFFHPWEFTYLVPYKLPSYVKRRAGQPMLNRLEKYLNWLKPQGSFTTIANFDQTYRQDNPPSP